MHSLVGWTRNGAGATAWWPKMVIAAEAVERGPDASLDGMHVKKVLAPNDFYHAPGQQCVMASLFEEKRALKR